MSNQSQQTKHGYGWRPQLPDQRDYLFLPRIPIVANLPTSVDLRKLDTHIYDQGQLGSCTANAIAAAFDFLRHKQGKLRVNPSRLFIYYNERRDDGDIETDGGSTIRESVKAVLNYGAPHETKWKYDIAKFAVEPPQSVYTEALRYQAVQYQAVQQSLDDMRACLAEGFPFVIGFSVYESFESDYVAKTGVVPMPAKTEKLLGGHAVMVVGYDDQKQHFIVRNSWGKGWGLAGYFFMPYSYLTSSKLSSDFWTLRSVE